MKEESDDNSNLHKGTATWRDRHSCPHLGTVWTLLDLRFPRQLMYRMLRMQLVILISPWHHERLSPLALYQPNMNQQDYLKYFLSICWVSSQYNHSRHRFRSYFVVQSFEIGHNFSSRLSKRTSSGVCRTRYLISLDYRLFKNTNKNTRNNN